jgi:hypothetical protein
MYAWVGRPSALPISFAPQSMSIVSIAPIGVVS